MGDQKTFWVHSDGKDFGPYTKDQLREYLDSGHLRLDQSACEADGGSDWSTVGQILGNCAEKENGNLSVSRPTLSSPWASEIDESSSDPDIVDMDQFFHWAKIELTERAKHGFDQNIYFGTDIPEGKLLCVYGGDFANGYAANARSNGEYPLVLLDETILGDASYGILITDKGLYLRDKHERKQKEFFAFDEIVDVSIKRIMLLRHLVINDLSKLCLISTKKQVADLLVEVIDYCREADMEAITNHYDRRLSQIDSSCHLTDFTKENYASYIFKLLAILEDDETVSSILPGVPSSLLATLVGAGSRELVALTTKRMIVVTEGFHEEFALDSILYAVAKGDEAIEIYINFNPESTEAQISRMTKVSSSGGAVIRIEGLYDKVANSHFVIQCGEQDPEPVEEEETTVDDKLERIEKLFKLFESGALTEDEFNREKKGILDS